MPIGDSKFGDTTFGGAAGAGGGSSTPQMTVSVSYSSPPPPSINGLMTLQGYAIISPRQTVANINTGRSRAIMKIKVEGAE